MSCIELSGIDSTIEPIEFLQANPNINAIDLLIPDLNGVMRGKRIERDALPKAYKDGICLPASLFSLDITGLTVEACGLGLELGEPDKVCKPIPGTLAPSPWQRRPMAQLMMSMYEPDGTPFFADPRHLLNSIVTRIKALGLTPVVAVELEFYLVDKARTAHNGPQPPISPCTGKREEHTQVYAIDNLDDYADFLEDIANYTALQGIPADTAVAEYAPGQFEINLQHQNDPLAACDNAMLLKRVIKAVAAKHGMDATFMAKPYADEAGNGMHIHISLVDEDGHNVFQGDTAAGSELLQHAVAGVLELMPASMALFCPNINSYRRFQPDFYVPMAPNWGFDNRTVAVRIPSGPESAKRIEHRVAGADANPYLVMSALLAAVHYGITQKMTPPPARTGNAFAIDGPTLPIRMPEALKLLRESAVLHEYFGKELLEVYLTCREAELANFEKHITQLETEWYLKTV